MGVGSMIFPVLVSNVMKEDQHMWFLVMLGVAIFSALTIYLQFKFTRERVTEELLGEGNGAARVKTASMGEQLKAVTSEKWWWLIILFYLAFQCSGAMKNGSMSYFCQWVIGAAGTMDWGMAQSILAVLGAIPMAVAAAVVVPLANKLSKRVVVMAGMLIGVAGGVIAGLGGGQIVPVAIGVALKCLGSAPAAYLILAMLADVIDHIEFKSGIRTDGLTMSIYSSVMVAATPICNAIFMAMLGGSGYVAPPEDAAAAAAMTQSAAVQSTIGISYIWIETVAYAICAALMLMWTVERDLPAEQETIAQRKKQCKG